LFLKKIGLIALFIGVAFAFTSCKKDSEDFNIVGKWKVDKTTIEYYMGDSASGTPIDSEVTENDGVIEFKADGTAIDTDGSEYTYTLKGDKLTIYESPNEVSFELTLTEKSNSHVKGYTVETVEEMGITLTIKLTMELSRI
jgi:hypothetical protein